jgi:hypothetical protein
MVSLDRHVGMLLRQDGTKWSASSRDRDRSKVKPEISRETSPLPEFTKEAYSNYIMYLCLMLIVDCPSDNVVSSHMRPNH